jgi:secreted PhoX family phosphatase
MFVRKPLNVMLSFALVAIAASAHAADNTLFDNFTAMTGDSGAGSLPEATPYKLSSPDFSQVTIADRATQNALVPGSNSGSFDMITANETGTDAGRYLFMPFESGSAGVQRIDLWDTNYATRTVTIVAPGTQGFASGDASRWTPWGSYLTAEESWGTGSTKGRLFEVTNATTADANGGNFIQRSIIPRTSHEGLAFDSSNNLYFVDELNGGSIYKYVSANPNATNGDDYFSAGQTFAMKVGAGGQFEGPTGAAITGAATWVPITDVNGAPLVFSTVLGDDTIDARVTADNANVLASGYNRPEDMEIKTLADGTQRIYFTTTDSGSITGGGKGRVYSLDLSTDEVKLFVDQSTIDMATGLAAGSAFKNPDNLAIDANGNIYIVEDQNGGVEDVWFAMDADNDGVAESIGKWASLSTTGAESTGLYFDKFDPNVAYINAQHPSSGVDRTIMLTATAPVPEAETYAMMLAGLGLVGFMVRRRKA